MEAHNGFPGWPYEGFSREDAIASRLNHGNCFHRERGTSVCVECVRDILHEEFTWLAGLVVSHLPYRNATLIDDAVNERNKLAFEEHKNNCGTCWAGKGPCVVGEAVLRTRRISL